MTRGKNTSNILVAEDEVMDEMSTYRGLCGKRTWGWRVVDGQFFREFFREIETQLVTLGFVD
jgi:hypothetical protein